MNRIITLIIVFTLSCTNVFSQAFYRVPIEKKGSEATFKIDKDTYKARFGITSESRRPKINFSSKTNYTYNSIYQDAKLDFEVFSCPKSKFSFLLINNYYDFSLGADLYIIENGEFSFIGTLSIGAYNSIEGERMNYNSILPYISIVHTTEKTYFSFETPLVVLNPGSQDERIIEGNKIHYTLSNNKLNQNITQ
ncbi:MAG: hypothetical protein PHN41_02725 [Bacteroidales bacterium]|jgi:hypothetical protein|nr:hypothetical protein [Bacteroidales bacterium]MDD4703835.1 hypothetical protein [Bacteroidales bacterium]MDX9797757.1 hypothetical protein [Bacteroidales bacterium]